MAWCVLRFSLVDNKREHNPPTQTHMRIKKIYVFNNIKQQQKTTVSSQKGKKKL
jgi:hypothetical protein